MRLIYQMNCLGITGRPLVVGIGAILTTGAEGPNESTSKTVLTSGGAKHFPACEVTSQKTERGDNAGIQTTLTALQRMIQEILDPLALQKRSVKEWRSLYRSFFALFAPDGIADETERKAWEIATDVFNTNLVAVCNRTIRVVPMTFQDFVDGVDSFKHDGLREGSQRDIAWQPKKILLLMAAMIGRVVAGWQADAVLLHDSPPDPFPFRNHLITANRNADFLGFVFDFDPRFSILEYGAAGLKPFLQAFHFASALMENGMFRCEFCPAQALHNPPLLRAHFLKPLRAPTTPGTLSTLDLVLLRKASPLTSEDRDAGAESSCFEFSRTALDALAFEPSDAPETKWSKLEKLFERAVTQGLLVCAAHRADASSASRIGKTLGRTQAERFVIERFFALGFRNGHGNEPWLERASSAPPAHDPDKVKKARKQFNRWKSASLFFLRAGQPQAAEITGASLRQEALQPKGSVTFLSLLNTPVYAPLMGVFLAADTQGKWLVNEPDLHAFARNLNGGAGKVLAEADEVITRYADLLEEREKKGVFLFECVAGTLLSACGGQKSPKRLACFERAKEALRQHYEQSFGVSLSGAPSALRGNAAGRAAQLAETKKKLEEAERTIMGLLAEPLSRKVSEDLRATLEALPKPGTSLAEQPVPAIRLENRTAFEESIAAMFAWLKSGTHRGPDAALSFASQFLTACVQLRAMAEEGRLEEALAKSTALYPTLSEPKKQALAPLFGELAWSLLQAIEQQLHHGNHDKAMALAENATAIIEVTPLRDEFKSLFETLFAARPAAETVPTRPPTGVSDFATRSARAQQAEVLLRDHADELGTAENQLEHEFLRAVRDGSDAAFRRREKLESRLQRRTRWGGREPYRTILKLLETSGGRDT